MDLYQFKRILKKSRITKEIYKFLADHKQHDRIRFNLQKNGKKTIRSIQSSLEETDVKFFFSSGTLLGIIREKKLIKHDLDLDIEIYITDNIELTKVRNALKTIGAHKKYLYEVEGVGIVEETYILNDINFDLFFHFKEENYDICYGLYRESENKYDQYQMDVVKYRLSRVERIIKIDFQGVLINIPENPEKYLEESYGSDWKIPDKNWCYWKDAPNIIPCNKRGKVTVF